MDDELLYLFLGLIFGGALLYFWSRLQQPASSATVTPPTQELLERIYEQIEAEPEPTPVPTRETNECGYPRFGYPNFAGTPRAGQGCVDDIDCQNHPPAGHPEYQECCQEDGTCFTR